MVKEFDFSPPYYRIIFYVFINRFSIQERKISVRNRIRKNYLEINMQTKDTKNRARVKYQGFPLRGHSELFEGTSQKQIKLFVKMY